MSTPKEGSREAAGDKDTRRQTRSQLKKQISGPATTAPQIETHETPKKQKCSMRSESPIPAHQSDQFTSPQAKQSSHTKAVHVLASESPEPDNGQVSVAEELTLGDLPNDFLLQQELARKRELKGSYKAKLSLERLIIEHERKKLHLLNLRTKYEKVSAELSEIGHQADAKGALTWNLVAAPSVPTQSSQASGGPVTKIHRDFLVKEMLWMHEDFDREHKKKVYDAKKNVRICRKELAERQLKQEKQKRDERAEVRRKANALSKMVQLFWRSCDRIVRHNHGVAFDRRRQQVRARRLENFVSKHLQLSVKVAKELNTKSFVEQSMYKDNEEDAAKLAGQTDQGNVDQVRIYSSQDAFDEPEKRPDQQMTALADMTVKMAEAFQPLGTDLQSANVATKIPFLLHGTLREYQIVGLDWLVTLHNKRLNGILADEMGLGKTIQTISLLASLACDRGIWGPHLIVVPTTIIINWEMEFKRWCPSLKILTYFGSQKERKQKRQGWSRSNSFHVCITSYKLVIQDHFAFRRKKWYYMVLDEAQNIKNFKSQRWQTLLRFNTRRRLLLTGTPLQNDVMELWSLMHFLMPQIFSNQQDFREWFSNPFSQSINQNQSLNLGVVQKLQSILRPFLLRRMKRDVEKQLPEKVEHIVQCSLSRRQRLLYDEYINSDRTKSTLSGTEFFGIMNVLMQLRKVCNHPDLFEARTIESPFIQTEQIIFTIPHPLHHFSQRLIGLGGGTNVPADPFRFEPVHLLSLEGGTRLQWDCIVALTPYSQLHQVSDNPRYLNASNTQNLNLTVPQILPHQPAVVEHHHPRFLAPACLPAASDYFRYNDQADSSTFDGSVEYKSSLTQQRQKENFRRRARQLIVMLHADHKNRLKIVFSCPVYGSDLRSACHVPTPISAVFETQGRLGANAGSLGQAAAGITYVNRHTKYYKQRNAIPPSTVLNPLCRPWFNNDMQAEGSSSGRALQESSRYKEIDIEESNYEAKGWIVEIEQPQVLVSDLLNQEGGIHQNVPDIEMVQDGEDPQKSKNDSSYSISDEKIAQLATQSINQHQNLAQNCEPDQINGNQFYHQEERESQKSAAVSGQNQVEKEHIVDGAIPTQEQLNDFAAACVELQQSISQSFVKGVKENVSPADTQQCIGATFNHEQMELDTIPLVNGEALPVVGEEGSAKKDEELECTNNPMEDHEESQADLCDDEANEKLRAQQAHNILQQEQQKRMQNLPRAQQNCEDYFLGSRASDTLREMIIQPIQRIAQLEDTIRYFKCIIPRAVAPAPAALPSTISCMHQKQTAWMRVAQQKLLCHRTIQANLKHSSILFFPHKNLIQYDCGKLQRLAQLLKTLYVKGSKVLIFTQMTRMLDILEQFLNLHGYTYVRLDGSVKVEARQKMVDRFNLSPRIFCFISSTRCGGIGINLTGADCVIFYDTDWNPAMDKQAQDRSHRIGQTKTVHIYRLISVNTVEENIFKKSLQKRDLGGLIIAQEAFDADFQRFSLRDAITSDLLAPRLKPRSIMDQENIVFHHVTEGQNNTAIGSMRQSSVDTLEDSLQRQREMEAYRSRFEEAMIRIEDEEDVEAFREAKAEMDDEFKEVEGAETGAPAGDPSAQVEGEQQQNEQAAGHEQARETAEEAEGQAGQPKVVDGGATTEGKQREQPIDSVSRAELRRHETVDWEAHAALNQVTKMAIQRREAEFTFEIYQREREEKEGTVGVAEGSGNEESELGEEDDEAENDAQIKGWDRQMVESIWRAISAQQQETL